VEEEEEQKSARPYHNVQLEEPVEDNYNEEINELETPTLTATNTFQENRTPHSQSGGGYIHNENWKNTAMGSAVDPTLRRTSRVFGRI